MLFGQLSSGYALAELLLVQTTFVAVEMLNRFLCLAVVAVIYLLIPFRRVGVGRWRYFKGGILRPTSRGNSCYAPACTSAVVS